MTPSADDILACKTSHELFGEAVHDRRGLKRAYAGLIKAYGPDAHPTVFAHIRALYEAAKRGDTGEPERPRPALRLVTDDEAPEPEPDATPAQQLKAAMEEGDPDRALRLLATHDLDLRIDHPGLWFVSIATLADIRTFSLTAELLQSWLDAIDGAPEVIPESMLARIELLTSTGVAYQAARRDTAIEPALLDLLSNWGKDPVTVTEAFMTLGEALPDDEAAWEAFQVLKVRYPELWFPYTLLVNQVTREVDSFNESTSPGLQAPRDPAWGRTWLKWRVTVPGWSPAIAILVALAGAAAVMWASEGTVRIGGLGLLAGFGVSFALSSGSTWRATHSDYDVVSKALVAKAQESALFPMEALDLAVPHPEEEVPDVLRHWQQNPTALLRVLTPAHVDRVRARLAEEQAAPETE